MSYVEWIRRRVGRRKIFLVYASVVIRDEVGRVLLHRRTDFEWWGVPGGVMEPEEDIVECARREVREETGLELGPLELVGVYSHPKYDVVYPNGDEVQQFTVCLTGQVAGGNMRPDGVETTEQRFFWPREMRQLHLPPWYRAMVSQAGRGPQLERPFRRKQVRSQRMLWHDLDGAAARVIAVSALAVVVGTIGTGEESGVLVLRASTDEPWRLPVAHLALGENGAAAAERAAAEQAGWECKVDRLLGVYSRPGMAIPGLEERWRQVGMVVQGRPRQRLRAAQTELTTFMSPAALAAQYAGTGAGALYELIREGVDGDPCRKVYQASGVFVL